MKRSDMIRYIAQNLRKKDQYITTNMDQCKYLVKLMLDSAETAGMIPPERFKTGDELGSESRFVSDNDWMHEDEKWEEE